MDDDDSDDDDVITGGGGALAGLTAWSSLSIRSYRGRADITSTYENR